MSRYESRTFFERLVELREAYRHLGTDDRVAVASVDEVAVWASVQLEGALTESEVDSGWG